MSRRTMGTRRDPAWLWLLAFVALIIVASVTGWPAFILAD